MSDQTTQHSVVTANKQRGWACSCGYAPSGVGYSAVLEHISLASRTAEATNAELLRLLGDHHRSMIAEEQLHPRDDRRYIGTKLYLETEVAIERAAGSPQDVPKGERPGSAK